MAVKIELNHTIVHARDAQVSAKFLTALFDLPPPEKFYHFLVVRTTNGVSSEHILLCRPGPPSKEPIQYAVWRSRAVF
jgi:hypothetical protein